jgi:hypothetical protein
MPLKMKKTMINPTVHVCCQERRNIEKCSADALLQIISFKLRKHETQSVSW